MSRSTKVFLVLLRLAIGWHFLFEGGEKIATYEGLMTWTPREGVKEYHANKPAFTSESYLRESSSPWLLGKFFRWLPGDSVLERYPSEAELATAPEAPALPTALEKDWKGYYDQFAAYYGLDGDQRKRAEEAFTERKQKTALWMYGKGDEKNTTITRSSPGGGAYQEETPMPERLREYRDAVRAEQEIATNYGTAVGAAADPKVEEAHQRVRELRTKLRTDLSGQSKKLMEKLQEVLYPGQLAERPALEPLDVARDQVAKLSEDQRKQEPAVAPAGRNLPDYGRLEWIDWLTRWGLVVIGACLLLGLFSRTAAVAGAGFLLLLVLAMLPGPWAPEVARGEGRMIVNKNFIEMLALLTLATTHSGRWLGLDALLHLPFARRRRPAVPVLPGPTKPHAASSASNPKVKEPVHGT